jgi:transcriptional regulator with XRE-family HTH domain
MQGVGKIIREARMRLRISQERLGEMTGVSRSAVNQWESGATMPESERLAVIARALGLDGGALLGLSTGAPANVTPMIQPKAGRTLDAAGAIPHGGDMPRDLPIRGTVSGGPGGLFQLTNGEPADWARRPPRLKGRSDVFGLWVEDTSMVPAFKPGSLIIVERARPPSIGDDVVVEIAPETPRDELRAIIKTLAASTPTHLKLAQHNPPKIIEVPRKRIVSIHRVMTMADLFGS